MILLALTVTVGSLAHAAPLPPALLGEVHGILSYCESVDRTAGDALQLCKSAVK
jgi:hypothetical protein